MQILQFGIVHEPAAHVPAVQVYIVFTGGVQNQVKKLSKQTLAFSSLGRFRTT
jgi:hypothetical protein